MQIAFYSGNPGKECSHLERESKGKPYTSSLWSSQYFTTGHAEQRADVLWVGWKMCRTEHCCNKVWRWQCFPSLCGKWWTLPTLALFLSIQQWNRQLVSIWADQGSMRFSGQAVELSMSRNRKISSLHPSYDGNVVSPGTLEATSDIQVDDFDDLESHILENSITCDTHNINTQKICIMTDFLPCDPKICFLQLYSELVFSIWISVSVAARQQADI